MELMSFLSATGRDNHYSYCTDKKAIWHFIKVLNDGSVTWLQLSQFFENGYKPSASDFVGEYVHYIRGTKFLPVDLAELIKAR